MKDATFTTIANLATKSGNIRIGENNHGVKCLIINGIRPVYDSDELISDMIPASIIIAILRQDVKANLLILAIAKELKDSAGKGISVSDCTELATRSVLNRLRIKCTYILRKEGDKYTTTDGEEREYTTNWYQLDTDSIKLSFGEHKSAYETLDAKYFIGNNEISGIEDF